MSHLIVSALTKGVVLAKLNRPERLNALSEKMGIDMINLCKSLDKDSSGCRGLILCGSERAFSTGRDLKASADHSKEEAKAYMTSAIESVRSVVNLGIPTCAVVSGYCIGWGFELMLACDFRVITKGARLKLPETGLGLFPGAGGVVLLPRLVGRSVANDLILTGREISGKEAYDLGIASRLGENDNDASNIARELMEKVASNAPLAVRAAKKVMSHCGEITNVNQAFTESRVFRDPLTNSKDHREALKAFAEKRKSVFEGK